MPQRIISRIITVCALSLATATLALAQSQDLLEAPAVPTRNSWQSAQLAGPLEGRLFVVTKEQPERRQTCRIQSFTADKLVCSRAMGGARTYLPQQVAVLMIPGNDASRHWLMFGFNLGMGAAIWGTVVLAATCPLCAVGTGIQAFLFLGGALQTFICDRRPSRLLYLVPGQQLSSKLGYVQS